MRRHSRSVLAGMIAVASALALAACGSSSSSTSSSSGSSSSSSSGSASAPVKTGGTVQFLYGVAPQSLDPGEDYTTQGAEINWVVYTGLTTYAHANGVAGTQLIPGLATACRSSTNGGKTYTATCARA